MICETENGNIPHYENKKLSLDHSNSVSLLHEMSSPAKSLHMFPGSAMKLVTVINLEAGESTI